MVVNKLLKAVVPHVRVVGSLYGFTKTCIRISTATTPVGAVVQGCKGIIIDCTPPVVKYPALCGAALACTVGACVTGDANFLIGALECGKCIIDS